MYQFAKLPSKIKPSLWVILSWGRGDGSAVSFHNEYIFCKALDIEDDICTKQTATFSSQHQHQSNKGEGENKMELDENFPNAHKIFLTSSSIGFFKCSSFTLVRKFQTWSAIWST